MALRRLWILCIPCMALRQCLGQASQGRPDPISVVSVDQHCANCSQPLDQHLSSTELLALCLSCPLLYLRLALGKAQGPRPKAQGPRPKAQGPKAHNPKLVKLSSNLHCSCLYLVMKGIVLASYVSKQFCLTFILGFH